MFSLSFPLIPYSSRVGQALDFQVKEKSREGGQENLLDIAHKTTRHSLMDRYRFKQEIRET